MSEDNRINVLIIAGVLSAGIGMLRPPTWVGALVLAADIAVAAWALKTGKE
ncbi:MAG: hypothetical protein Q4D87_04715 [Actinomycetaceae bacterium]|nr:hypothetical protein [Actinomycetaceae bacterium]